MSSNLPALAPALLTIRQQANRLLRKHWVISGKEKHSGEALRILYAGSPQHARYIAALAFGDSSETIELGIGLLVNSHRLCSKHQCDALIIESSTVSPPFFCPWLDRGLRIPAWVSAEVDIDAGLALLKTRKSLKEDQRRIRKAGLHYIVSREPGDFHDFYYNMYRPTVLGNHGESALPRSFNNICCNPEQKIIIKVMHQDEWIAGKVIDLESSPAKSMVNGVRDNNPLYFKMRAMCAAYTFTMQYLQQLGHKRLSMGGSRGFLSDGVLQFKNKWNLDITETIEPYWYFLPVRPTQGLKSFLTHNPCFDSTDQLKIIAFANTDEDFQLFVSRCKSLYHYRNIDKVLFYTDLSVDRKSLPDRLNSIIEFRSSQCLFS